MINKLINKLDEIRKQKERATATLNALVGAEQVLMQLLDEETNKESEVVENATDSD